jgi:hypothetical protein
MRYIYKMSTGKAIADICVRNLGGTADTAKVIIAHLRKADILPPTRPGRAAADLSSRDAVAVLVALALAPTNTKAVETVRRVLALEMLFANLEGETVGLPLTVEKARNVFDYLRDIGIHPLHNLGEALTALLDSMRSGVFAEWAVDGGKEATLEFRNDGQSVSFYALPATAREGVFIHFGAVARSDRGPTVTRLLRIDERLLLEIVAALGPLPCPVPLPTDRLHPKAELGAVEQ